MNKLTFAFAVSAFAVAAAPAGAQPLKPGLWEITNKMQGGSAPMENAMTRMQQQMAAMSPEQRKLMQEQMAKSGVRMDALGPAGGMSIKVCLTKEMAEKSEVPSQQGNCTSRVQGRSGNTVKTSFACTDPVSSGEGETTFSSPQAYTSRMTVTRPVQGKPEKVTMEGSGKWLGADCGNVKPLAQQEQKK